MIFPWQRKIMTFFFCIFYSGSFGQQVTITPYLGINMSKYTTPDVYIESIYSVDRISSNKITGMSCGMNLSYRINRQINIISGIGYYLDGNVYRYIEYKTEHRFHNINIPVLLEYKLCNNLSLYTGLTNYYMFKHTQKTIFGDTFLNPHFKKYNVDVPIGLSLNMGNICFDVEYKIGLINRLKENIEGYSRSLSFKLGYNIFMR